MFYEKEKINELLNCKKCSLKLDSQPKIIQCGATVCSSCIESILVFDQKFTCPVCQMSHTVPLKGFVINKGLSAFLTVRPIQVSRSPAAYSLKASLTEIQKQMQAIFLAKISSADQVKSHCIDLKNDVQLATEETIMLINKYNQELIEKIDDYQRDCLLY